MQGKKEIQYKEMDVPLSSRSMQKNVYSPAIFGKEAGHVLALINSEEATSV